MIRVLQTSLVILCANIVLGHGSVPDSGGAYCPPKAISPVCDSCCKDAGGSKPASTAIPIRAAGGTHNTPASAPATAGSLSAGGSTLARGIPAASNATQGRFAGVDLMTGVPDSFVQTWTGRATEC